jgi:hypothetical protein
VIQLGHLFDYAAAAEAAMHVLKHELEEFVTSWTIIVTFTQAHFLSLARNEFLPPQLPNEERCD